MRELVTIIGIMVLAGVIGCSSSTTSVNLHSGHGSMVVSVQWPERTRLIPAASESLRLVAANAANYREERVIDRPADSVTVTVVFDAVPTGEITLEAIAYPQAGGQGVPQAAGRAVVTVVAEATAQITLTMTSSITQLVITAPAPLEIGESVTLTAVPRDTQGRIVLVADGQITWTSSNDVATVDADGRVTAQRAGSAIITATDTESGVSGTVNVQVQEAPPPPPPPPPDGGRIAFLSDRNGGEEIFVMNADGSNVRHLPTVSGRKDEIAISPDGQTIAFIANGAGNYEIYTIGIDGSGLRRLTTTSNHDWGPSFSPDGRQIVYFESINNQDEIFTMNADGSNARRLTSNSSMDVMPIFTPDGGQIVFSSDRGGNYDLFTMGTDGSNPRALRSGGENEWYATITPDGGTIAYVQGGSNYPDGGLIAAVNRDGSGYRRLTNPAGYRDHRPSFSPDGAAIAFASTRDGRWAIYVMDADGGNPRRLTDGTANDRYPVWGT
jgi:TolB protein